MNRQGIDAQFNLALRHHRAGQLREAERLYRSICASDGNHVGSLHLLGVLTHQFGGSDAADLLARAIRIKPDFAEAHHDLGVVLGAQGRLKEAVACFEQAVRLKPDYAQAHSNLGAALSGQGRHQEAIARFERALALSPDFPSARLHLGNALMVLGEVATAVTHYRAAVALDPNFVIAHFSLATALKQQGMAEEALPHYERTVALAPDFADAHNNFGHALNELGRPEQAVARFERALAINPGFAGARNNLANTLRELGRLDEAVEHYRGAMALQPGFAPAHYNLGVALRGQSKLEEAKACFERAVAIQPDFIEAKFAHCMAQLPILYRNEAEIEQRRAAYRADLVALRDDIEHAPMPERLADVVGAHQPFYLAYQGRPDTDLQAMYGSLVCGIMAARYPPALLAAPPAAGEPVRVGVVSGFLRQHSNWKIPIKGWLTKLDRGRFRIFGYSTGAEEDEETEAAAAVCERFVRGPMPVERWRHEILRDAPHVLIYPEVGMDRIGAQLAAQRLAPVQCNSWGHPETSGFPTLDYFLSSDLMEPPDGQEHYTERLIRLPNLSICYEPLAELAPGAVDRAALGVEAEGIHFWCGQAIYKYLPQFDEVFPRIAREVGKCQFVFIRFPGAAHVTDAFRERLDRAFSAFGLSAAGYCTFLPRLDRHQFVAAIGECEVVLDSIGWSGCNSILESLAHNLPIVTVEGALMRGRHAGAILRMMDVTDTIADTVDAYVAMAVRLARDAALRAAVGGRMAECKHRLYGDASCIAALEKFLERAARRSSEAEPGPQA